MSPRTLFLAKLLGLYCVALAIPMLAHAQATVEVMKEIVQTPPLLFMAGLMGMTAGLAIVLAHNVWSGGALPVIVTLFGWAALIKGMLLLLLSPDTESRVFIIGLRYDQHPYPYALFLLLLGAYLTYAAFHSEARPSK